MPERARLFLLVPAVAALAASAAGTAHAQVPGLPGAEQRPLRPDSLPPLPDTIRLYGDTLTVRTEPPDLAPPPGALLLSLEEAIRVALAQSPALAIDVAEAERARNDATRGNAGFLPTLDATAGLGGTRSGGGIGGDSTGAGVRASTSATGDVTLGYTVFDGFRRDATLRRLEAEATQFFLTADAQAEVLAFSVTSAYLDVVRQEGLAGALAGAVAVSEDRFRIEQAEVQIGTAAEIDAALALSDLNADRAGLLRQALALTEARAALGALLALPDPLAVAVTDTLALGSVPDLAVLAAAASSENRRVRALEVAELAAREAVAEVRAERYPTVRVAAGLGFTALGPRPPATGSSSGAGASGARGCSASSRPRCPDARHPPRRRSARSPR